MIYDKKRKDRHLSNSTRYIRATQQGNNCWRCFDKGSKSQTKAREERKKKEKVATNTKNNILSLFKFHSWKAQERNFGDKLFSPWINEKGWTFFHFLHVNPNVAIHWDVQVWKGTRDRVKISRDWSNRIKKRQKETNQVFYDMREE